MQSRSLSKIALSHIAKSTIDILNQGSYLYTGDLNNNVVNIKQDLINAIESTLSIAPNIEVTIPKNIIFNTRETKYKVVNDTTLNMAQRMVLEGEAPAILNFASARNPGGGFQSGANAQEESLARASGLYACIKGSHMYEYHRQCDNLYSDYVIYSPNVPIFRNDAGELLSYPYKCSFLTCAAPNLNGMGWTDSRRSSLPNLINKRIAKILSVAANNEHDSLVLGAWGCGVFMNSATMVAQAFKEQLEGNFKGVFNKVAFAVLDSGGDIIKAFEKEFGE